MTVRWNRRQAFVAILCAMLLIVTAACGSGDDDDTSGATATVTAGSSAAGRSPTASSDTEATATEARATEAEATATRQEAQPSPTRRAQATATKARAEATATSDDSGSKSTEPAGGATTTGEGSADVPEIETLDPALLPNFSLTMNFDATNLSGTPQTTIKMQMEQSAVDQYHLNMETDGQTVELWTIGDQSWTSVAGEIVESPTGPLFSPADILTTGELIPEGLKAREDGSEEVNGRATTRWVVDGADYVAYMNEQAQTGGTSTVEMTDGTGEVTIWIDDELKIMIKAQGDVAWKNSDDSAGSLVYNYEILDIGSTAEVVAPQ